MLMTRTSSLIGWAKSGIAGKGDGTSSCVSGCSQMKLAFPPTSARYGAAPGSARPVPLYLFVRSCRAVRPLSTPAVLTRSSIRKARTIMLIEETRTKLRYADSSRELNVKVSALLNSAVSALSVASGISSLIESSESVHRRWVRGSSHRCQDQRWPESCLRSVNVPLVGRPRPSAVSCSNAMSCSFT